MSFQAGDYVVEIWRDQNLGANGELHRPIPIWRVLSVSDRGIALLELDGAKDGRTFTSRVSGLRAATDADRAHVSA